MSRIIVDEKAISADTMCERVVISDNAAVLIIENCNKCDWKARVSKKRKPFCMQPRTMVVRPYVDDPENGRIIEDEFSRPEWCPFNKIGV